MNINLKIAFFAVLFSAPTSLYSEQTVRIVSKEDCQKFFQKFLAELEQESEATRPDGKPTRVSKELKSVLDGLKKNEEVKQKCIEGIFISFSSDYMLSSELEDEKTFQTFYFGYMIAILRNYLQNPT